MHTLARLVVAAITFSCGAAWAQTIEIKGLSVGMSQADFEQKFGPSPLRDFTIADVPSKYKKVDFFFREERLDSFNFYFAEDDFEHLLDALRAKYPKLRCQQSPVTNLFGARLAQVECGIKDKLGGLSLTRFVNDVNTSGLTLYSNELVQELKQKKKKPNRDL
jgi:hypothetical protein